MLNRSDLPSVDLFSIHFLVMTIITLRKSHILTALIKLETAFCGPAVSRSYLAGTIQIFLLLGELVKGQEGVAITGGAVADPVAFSEQAPLPDDLSTFSSLFQVLFLFKHLAR